MTWNIETAARTIWGEARNQGHDGMVAVGHVIVNRLKAGRWGPSLASVCLWPWQFSCFNFNDPNRAMIMRLDESDPGLVEPRMAIMEAMTAHTDPTLGAMFYQVVGTGASWSVGHKPCLTLKDHEFYNDVM